MAVEPPAAAAPPGPDPANRASVLFWQRYEEGARKAVDFIAGAGVRLTGLQTADVGCGDGILSIGVASREKPARLVAFDILKTDVEHLIAECRREGVPDVLPECVEFVQSEPCRLPAEDASFDVVLSWSAFEHIEDPGAVLREMRRVLRPWGVIFIQLWPFYHSEHGSHLWEWFPEGFAQFSHSREDIEAKVRANGDAAHAEFMLGLHLNRITVDDLHRAILAAGLRIARLELMAGTVNVPAHLAHYPPSWVGVGGVMLLAVPL